jgi:phage host-nuclease inhibitor protein Gam
MLAKPPTTDDIIRGYIELRDRIEAEEKAAMEALQAKIGPLKKHLETLENAITALLLTLGADEGHRHVTTPHGVAYRERWDSYSVEDRETWMDFVFNTESSQFVTNHVVKEAVRTHMDEHNGMLPPGLKSESGYKTRIRRR